MINTGNNYPSPWLDSIGKPHPNIQASFVEYLRWMRLLSGDSKLNSAKLLELLKLVQEGNYSQTLQRLTERTQRLATEWFLVKSPWRIRVGGATGPESMLLPAFDALGMPYIPSSTLKGVTRDIAKREGVSPEQIRKIFGDINHETSMGIVTFLDAYPLPLEDKLGGVCPDMANAIWTWDKDNQLQYQPNPNVFLSLLKPTFVIGLRKGKDCSNETLQQAKQWLLKGLTQGIGSRVNSGYGELKLEGRASTNQKNTPILRIPFELQGQLIHGYQQIKWRQNDKGNWEPKPEAVPEVRPIAFRSMLRYWFRAFALGVLSTKDVQKTERFIFGGIEPKAQTGLFQIEIANPDNSQTDYQAGTLILRHSSLTGNDNNQLRIQKVISQLLNSLTWLMFHLGGIGQGARRPYYKRPNQNPVHRGVDLIPKIEDITSEKMLKNWQLPLNTNDFRKLFHQQLIEFYSALGKLIGKNINYQQPLDSVIAPTTHTWIEAVDINCEILVIRKAVKDSNNTNKTYPLKVLNDLFHDLESQNYTDAKSLCGGIKKESIKDGNKIDRDVIPSPVWIVNLHKYQVITVFGATQNPRKEYLRILKQSISKSNVQFDSYSQIWPIQ